MILKFKSIIIIRILIADKFSKIDLEMTTLFDATPVLVDREKERRHVISQHSVKLYLIPCCVIGEYNHMCVRCFLTV